MFSMPTILQSLPEAISELFLSNTAYHSYNTRNKQNLRPKVSKRAYMCSILTKESGCCKKIKLRFLFILIEQIMTNLLKK